MAEKGEIEVVEMNASDEKLKPDVEVYDVNQEKKATPAKPKKKAAKQSKRPKKKAAPTKPKKQDEPNLLIGIVIFVVLLGLVLFFYWDTFFPPGDGMDDGEVWATVNGQPITRAEVEGAYERLQPRYGPYLTMMDVLNQTVSRILLIEAAKDRGITVTDEEVETAYSELVLSLPPGQDMEEVLAAQGVTIEEAKKELSDQLYIERLFEGFVTEEEVEQYYEDNPERFTAQEGQIRARHLLVPTLEEAQAAKARIDAGEDFSVVAAEVSQDTATALRGGDLGFFGEGVMVQEFNDAAFSLEVGEVSDPVETQFGYHVIKREPGVVPLAEIREIVEQTVLVEKLPAFLEQLRQEADVVIYYEPEESEEAEADVEDILPAEELEIGEDEEPEEVIMVEDGTEEEPEAMVPEVGMADFKATDEELCTEDGLPVVRLYSTTVCPHCNWVKETFDSVVQEYAGRIQVEHWQLDTKDDTLTPEQEGVVPQEEVDRFLRFNPDATVPTYVIGCEYSRVGNAFEDEDDLVSEAQGFRNVIDAVLA